jgi:glycosyltransferase involved in cell wall biosynthesis
MRIAFVTETYPPEINGVAITVARTAAYLRSRGHEVELIRPTQPGEARGRRSAECGEWLSAGFPRPVYRGMRFGLARPATLAARFARAGTELVHVATEGPLGWAAIAAAHALGIAATSDFRTNFHQYSRFYRIGWLEPAIAAYLRRFHNATARTFVPTRGTQRELAAAGFERLRVVDRGVDLERFSPAHRDDALRREWGAEGPVLLYVGRIAAEKRVELALQAFAAARRIQPRLSMVVVGEGPRRQALEIEFPDVRFVGNQTGAALSACYASADIFLFPSETDTFGNVTLEALASGLPVVAFDLAAASEHVIDRISGRLVPPGNDAAFVIATCQISSPSREFSSMRAAARRGVSAQDWDSVLSRFENHLREAIVDAEPARRHAPIAA